MNTAALTFSGLSSGYGKRPILSDISGQILSGRVTALVGPNGSGKSTLLRVLGGLLPYRGSAALFGKELKRYPRRALGRLLGIVAQGPTAKAAFTVRDVIAFGRLPWQSLLGRPSPKDIELIDAAAERLGLTAMASRKITELSGGERQRAFLAMVLAQDTPILLLDEPTSAMDPRQAMSAFALMRELSAAGRAVVVAAHDLNAALTCSDNFLALKGGRLVAQGLSHEVDAHVLRELYDTPFSAYFSEKGERIWFPSHGNP